VLGQYVPILASVDRLKEAASAGDVGAMLAEWAVVVPVGLGVVVGIAGLSNLIKWLLHHKERPTLGVLLGLLVGSVLGLYPFQRTAEVMPGDELSGMRVVDIVDVEGEPMARVESADGGVVDLVERAEWPTAVFTPSLGQVAASLGLGVLGLGITLGIAHFGRVKDDEEAESAADAAGGGRGGKAAVDR
jgi:putative membrane protein